MLDTGKYDFINAKVHGMRSKLYDGDRLNKLLSARSLVELIRDIYPKRLNDFPPKALIAEKKLVESFLDDLFRIKKSLNGKEEKIIDILIEKYYLENLKVIIKFWQKKQKYNRKVDDLEKELNFYLIKQAEVPPIRLLLSSEDFSEFYHSVPKKKYSKAIEKASRLYYRTKNSFFIELSLDLEYFRTLWEHINRLNRADKKIAQKIYGTEIDWQILSWICRLNKNYDITYEEVSSLFDFNTYKLEPNRIKQIFSGTDLSELETLKNFPPCYRSNYKKTISNENVTADDLLWSQLYREARRLFPINLFNLGLIICYTVFKRVEIMNLIRLIQGMKYSMPKPMIKKTFLPLGDWER